MSNVQNGEVKVRARAKCYSSTLTVYGYLGMKRRQNVRLGQLAKVVAETLRGR